MASSRASSSTIRGPSWSHDEILALIRVWSDQSIQGLLGDNPTRTADIYKKIAEGLEREAGYQRTPKQCKDKLKNLKQFYKDVKDGHERSGYNRDNWPYFELIDAILGDRPATRPPVVVDTTIQAVSDGSPEQRSTSSTSRSTARSNSSVDVIPPVDCEDCGGDIDDIEDGVEEQEEGAEEGQPTTSGTTAGQRRSSSARGLPTSKRAKKTGIERA